MKALSRLIVKLADLVEAEGRALRSGVMHAGLAFSFALAAAAIGVGGVGLVGWSIFTLLRNGIGEPGAAAICGVALLACAGGLIWIIRMMSR